MKTVRCFTCKGNKNLTKDHIIPKRHGARLNASNTMILCRKCHDWKEKGTVEVYKNGIVVGVYNPILKKKLLFSKHPEAFIPGVARANPKKPRTVFKKIKAPKVRKDTRTEIANQILTGKYIFDADTLRAKAFLQNTLSVY